MSETKIESESIRQRILEFRKRALVLVNHPKYKLAQKVVWAGCILWAGVIVAQSIPYYFYIGQGKEAFLKGHYLEAKDLFSAAIKESEHADDSDPRLANALNNMGELYRKQGKYGSATNIYLRMEKIAENNMGKKRQEAAILLNNVAAFHRDEGDYKKAEAIYKKAINIWENEVKKLKDPNYAALLTGLARDYKEQGRYAEAEPLLAKALEIREKAQGSNHPDVAAVLCNQGALYRKEAKYSQSEACYRRALKIDMANYGWQHPDTQTDVNSLAGLFRETKRYAEADKLYDQALSTRKLLLGVQHPETARSMLGLGELRSAQGRYDEAISLLSQSLKIDTIVFGTEKHPDCADCLNALSVVYRKEGNYKLAEDAIQRCLTIRKSMLPAGHPDLTEAFYNQSEIYRLQHGNTKNDALLSHAKPSL